MLEYLMKIGMGSIQLYEKSLKEYAEKQFDQLDWLSIQGNASEKGAIFSFTMKGTAHAHDISTIIDRRGIAVRAGHHCAQPLMKHLGVNATCRASFGMYNSTTEIDELISSLKFAYDILG